MMFHSLLTIYCNNVSYCTCISFRCRQSCGDGCGSATIKISSPQPREVSLRLRSGPMESSDILLLVETSLQYDLTMFPRNVKRTSRKPAMLQVELADDLQSGRLTVSIQHTANTGE